MVNDNYFETLGEAAEAANKDAVSRQIVFHFFSPYETMTEHICSESIGYGGMRNFNFPIAHLKGKVTRKYFHVNIWRLDSGRYELNTYIL